MQTRHGKARMQTEENSQGESSRSAREEDQGTITVRTGGSNVENVATTAEATNGRGPSTFTIEQVNQIVRTALKQKGARPEHTDDVAEDNAPVWKKKDRMPDIKLAVSIIMKDKWEKLQGPTNYRKWHGGFRTAMIVSNFWPFFEGDYDDIKDSTNPEAQRWHELYSSQAIQALKYACEDDVILTLDDISSPKEALELVEDSNKTQGNAYLWSILKEFFECNQDQAGSVEDFKRQLNKIQARLRAVNEGYKIPLWMLNSAFLCKLSPMFDNRVSVLNADKQITDLRNPTDFNILARQIQDEEQRQQNQDTGSTHALAAIPRCSRCGRKGHSDVAGKNGCFQRPGNEKYRVEFQSRMIKTGTTSKKRANMATSNEQQSGRKRRIEKADFHATNTTAIADVYGPSFNDLSHDE